MADLGYNTGVDHIKSDGLFQQHRHQFSTDVGGIVTMSDHTPQLSALKVCTKCGDSKPFSEFYKRKDGRYNLSPWCKPCSRAARQEYYRANRDDCIESMCEWRARNP